MNLHTNHCKFCKLSVSERPKMNKTSMKNIYTFSFKSSLNRPQAHLLLTHCFKADTQKELLITKQFTLLHKHMYWIFQKKSITNTQYMITWN